MENKACQMCGGVLTLDADKQHYTCDSCGLKFDAQISKEERKELDDEHERLENKLNVIMFKKRQCKEQLDELDNSKGILNKLLVGISAGLLTYVFIVFLGIAVTKTERLWPMWFLALSIISWIVSSSIFSKTSNPFGGKTPSRMIFYIVHICTFSIFGLVSGVKKYFKVVSQLKRNDEIKKELIEKIQHYTKEENKIKQEIDY